MDAPDDVRRSLLFGIGGIAMTHALPQSSLDRSHAPAPEAVLDPQAGEHLLHFRDRGNIFIKVSGASGTGHLAMGTQQVTAGAGVPIHRHFEMEESFYVLDGSGFFILDDVRHAIRQGSTIFIPKKYWHGFANPEHELLLLWIVSPAGLDGFFKETCMPPGVPPKQFTPEQIREIALKYGTEFR
jgi:quercetin dioxygenase-like cupin family protein